MSQAFIDDFISSPTLRFLATNLHNKYYKNKTMHTDGVDVLLRKLHFLLSGKVLTVERSSALLAPLPWILESTLGCWISEWIIVKEGSFIYSFSWRASLPSWPRWSRFASNKSEDAQGSLGAKPVLIVARW
jgi:hypothetical protein